MLTEPETVVMTAEQRQHAVDALANMMVAWLRRESDQARVDDHPHPPGGLPHN
jgi:hypothetical protein